MGGVDKTGIRRMKSTHVLTGFNILKDFPPFLPSCCFDMKLPKSRSTHHIFINMELKQTDAAAERRRSHSNLHSIKECMMSGAD